MLSLDYLRIRLYLPTFIFLKQLAFISIAFIYNTFTKTNAFEFYTYLYLSNNIANTYASPIAKGSIINPAMAIPRTIQGLISKYLAIPAHTPDTFACSASLKNRLSLSIVFIVISKLHKPQLRTLVHIQTFRRRF